MPPAVRGKGRPETLVAYAERQLKAALADGTIEPGDRLSPHLLAPELGLSHIPIREALSSLAAKGFVVHKQGRGYFARELSSEDLIDIYRWREVLEREVYKIAVPMLTDEDIEEMAGLVEEMSHLTAAEHRLEYLELNRQFHFVAFKRAGSRRVLRFLGYLWDSAQLYTALDLRDSSKGHAEHVEMLKLLTKRDVEKVIKFSEKHRKNRLDHVAEWEAANAAREKKRANPSSNGGRGGRRAAE